MDNFLGSLQWYDYMRLATCALMFIALYVSGRRASKLWSIYTERLRELWWTFNAALLFIAEGCLEAIFQDAPWGPRVLFFFLLSIAAVKSTFRKGGYLSTEENTP